MFSTVLRYEIETIKDRAFSTVWTFRNSVKPNYRFEQLSQERRFLWLRWIWINDVITNERKARISARRKAFRTAKKLYPEYDVRVFVVFQFPEIDQPIRHLVWENGHYYSTH